MALTKCKACLGVYNAHGQRVGRVRCTKPIRHRGDHDWSELVIDDQEELEEDVKICVMTSSHGANRRAIR